MKIIEFIRNKTSQFAEKGLLGYLMALFFFIFMAIAITSPLWLIILSVYFLGNIID